MLLKGAERYVSTTVNRDARRAARPRSRALQSEHRRDARLENADVGKRRESAGPGPPGAAKRPQRFPEEIIFVRRFYMGAQSVNSPNRRFPTWAVCNNAEHPRRGAGAPSLARQA